MADNHTVANTDVNTARNEHKKAAEAKTKKSFWARYIDRLANTRCTFTPPECR